MFCVTTKYSIICENPLDLDVYKKNMDCTKVFTLCCVYFEFCCLIFNLEIFYFLKKICKNLIKSAWKIPSI